MSSRVSWARTINIYVGADLYAEMTRHSGLNYSRIARSAIRAAIAEQDKIVAEYGPPSGDSAARSLRQARTGEDL